MRHQHKAIMMLKVVNGLCPSYLLDMFTFHKTLNGYSLRSSNNDLVLPKTRTNFYKNSFVFSGVKVWNALSCSLKKEISLDRVKAKLNLIDNLYGFVLNFYIVIVICVVMHGF